MNDGNMWNREHHNESRNINETEKRPFRGKPAKDSKKQSNPQRKNTNNRNSNKPSVSKPNSQDKLLQELVQQNHTIIGLLRGIKNAIISGETHPEQANAQVVTNKSAKTAEKKVEKTENKNVTTARENESSDSDTNKKSGKSRKQFVMRFDDKEPLNLDLEDAVETIAIVEKVVEKNSDVIDIATQNEDENSLGESNPFSFFDK